MYFVPGGLLSSAYVNLVQLAVKQVGFALVAPMAMALAGGWTAIASDPSRMDLLAHCVSFGVNALYEKPNPYSGTGVSQHGLDIRLSQADRLARSTGLDDVTPVAHPPATGILG